MMTLDEMRSIAKGATFSDCKKFRYALWRCWNPQLPAAMFIGFNPSTANARKLDNTTSRVKELCKSWGYGTFYMMNLFPFITSKPEILEKWIEDNKQESKKQIKENDRYLLEISKKCDLVIFAWGAFDTIGRDKDIMKMFPNAKCLLINDDGSPQHPLYVPKTTKPIEYKPIK
jgi:hypothetical protein